MKRTLIPLLCALLLVTACRATPMPDLQATVRAAVAATQTAQPTPTSTPPPLVTATPLPTTPPQPTATNTLVPTSVPTDTPIPTNTPPPTKTPVPTPVPTPIPFPAGPYVVVGVEIDDWLNVRVQAGATQPIVGTIPFYGTGVQAGGSGQEVDGSLWIPIHYQTVTGWVNSHYLARQVGSPGEAVAARAAEVIMALHERDLDRLSTYVHPDLGLRFSPYTYVRVGSGTSGQDDLVFTAAEVKGLFDDTTVYEWGQFDGSGDPIEMTFTQYYDRFVYDVEFAYPDAVAYNLFIGQGNTINNIPQVYPDAATVEYHFEGFDPQYAGMDWRSLRLVLEEKAGTWYLVGIVHDEWTI